MYTEGRTFYSRPQRTVFGASLLYREQEGHPLKVHYFDVVSAVLTHDSWITIQWLKEIFACEEWKQFGSFYKIHFWMDNGPAHFRTGVTFHYLVNQAAMDAGVTEKLSINYFAENHGKSICDSHFSMISKAMADWTKEVSVREEEEEEEEGEGRGQGNVIWNSFDVAKCLTAKFNYWREKRQYENQHRRPGTKAKKEWDFTILIRDEATRKQLEPDDMDPNHTLPENFKVYFHFLVSNLKHNRKVVKASVWSSDCTLHPVSLVTQTKKRKATALKTSSLPSTSTVTSKNLLQRQTKRQKVLSMDFFIFISCERPYLI